MNLSAHISFCVGSARRTAPWPANRTRWLRFDMPPTDRVGWSRAGSASRRRPRGGPSYPRRVGPMHRRTKGDGSITRSAVRSGNGVPPPRRSAAITLMDICARSLIWVRWQSRSRLEQGVLRRRIGSGDQRESDRRRRRPGTPACRWSGVPARPRTCQPPPSATRPSSCGPGGRALPDGTPRSGRERRSPGRCHAGGCGRPGGGRRRSSSGDVPSAAPGGPVRTADEPSSSPGRPSSQ